MHTTKILISAVAASLLLALPAHAADEHQHAPAAVKAPAAPLQQMQANVKKMQVQLTRIGRTKNDEARHRLVEEHLQTLRDNMMLAQEIAGDSCSMMEHGKAMSGHPAMGMMEHRGGMAGEPGAGKEEHCGGMMERMQQLEKRMEMMAPAK